MNEEEEWDADFLDQLIQVEELALSSSNPSQHHPLSNYYPPPPQQQQQQQQGQQHLISYSPPRELSQRPSSSTTTTITDSLNGVAKSRPSTTPFLCPPPPPSDNASELEIQRLKRELGRVSKQLTELEHECVQLRKERNQKQEQIKSVYPHNEDIDAGVRFSKSTNSIEYGIPTTDCHGVSRQFENAKASEDQVRAHIDIATSSCKAIGVQTDGVGDFIDLTPNDDLPTCLGLSEKLQGIWGSPSDQKLGRNVISRLLVACPADFHVLFGCMSMNTSSKVIVDSLAGESSSDVALQCHIHSFHTLEAAKVSHLYSVLTKISNGMMQLEALFEPLIDLCSLENVVIIHRSLRMLHVFLKHHLTLERKPSFTTKILNFLQQIRAYIINCMLALAGIFCTVVIIHRSLRILRVFLKHLLTLERKSGRRDNVMVEGLCSRNRVEEFHGYERVKNGGLLSMSRDEASFAGHIPFGIRSDAENQCKRGHFNPGFAMSLSCVNWVSLFELMYQIAVRNIEEFVRFEAVSIMNVILLRSNAHMEREKFGRTHVFESISQLLKKEAGLHVQKEAVHLLYLLLNCPKLLVTFLSGCNEADSAGAANDGDSTSKVFISILEGLADCIACCGNGVQDLELRRNAIILLAFLASSGKSGFEILLSHKLSREANFLMLILQVLVSEIDIEAAAYTESTEILKARTLLVREALILLNRLVSNPAYSATVLRALTNSRDMASLTVDIANRLSRNDQKLGQSDSLTRQMRESDIVDLARVFRKRVFTYLGDTIS